MNMTVYFGCWLLAIFCELLVVSKYFLLEMDLWNQSEEQGEFVLNCVQPLGFVASQLVGLCQRKWCQKGGVWSHICCMLWKLTCSGVGRGWGGAGAAWHLKAGPHCCRQLPLHRPSHHPGKSLLGLRFDSSNKCKTVAVWPNGSSCVSGAQPRPSHPRLCSLKNPLQATTFPDSSQEALPSLLPPAQPAQPPVRHFSVKVWSVKCEVLLPYLTCYLWDYKCGQQDEIIHLKRC